MSLKVKLYRYVKALEIEEKSIVNKKLKNSLQEHKIYFSHPASFNDPLECTIPITIDNYDKYANEYLEYIENILSKTIGCRDDETDRNKRIYEALEFGIPIEKCLTTCFAQSDSNQLMWSHYADQHRGVCLCYEFPDTTEEWEAQIKWCDSIARDMKNYNMYWCGKNIVTQVNDHHFILQIHLCLLKNGDMRMTMKLKMLFIRNRNVGVMRMNGDWEFSFQ